MRIDTKPELRLLSELGTALATAGVNSHMRSDFPALAVNTAMPGVYVWVYISPSGQRFACYLDNLREYLASDPQYAARMIAAHTRGLAGS